MNQGNRLTNERGYLLYLRMEYFTGHLNACLDRISTKNCPSTESDGLERKRIVPLKPTETNWSKWQ